MAAAARLIARLFDGSEHEVKLFSGDPEGALKSLMKTDRRWVDVIGGAVRYDHIVSLLIVEEPAPEKDHDQAINELLRDLQAKGGGTLHEAQLELERRGIAIPETSRSATDDPAKVSVPSADRRKDPSSHEAD